MMFPSLSVVIPTLRRLETVIPLTDALLGQDYPALFEVILVAQVPEDVAALRSQWSDPRVRVVESTPPGTTRARNRGVVESRSDVVVFLDDDVELTDALFLRRHGEVYADTAIVGVGGKVLEDPALQPGPHGEILTVGPTGVVYPSTDSDTPQSITAPRGGNMSFRRSVILAVGGFDERFVGNAMREETDFSLRVVAAGHRLWYAPGAVVRHLAHPTGGSRSADRRQWYEDFFTNETFFFRRHFAHVPFATFLRRKARAILACMFYYGKGRPSWLVTPWRGIEHGRALAAGSDSRAVRTVHWPIVISGFVLVLLAGALAGVNALFALAVPTALVLGIAIVLSPRFGLTLALVALVFGQVVRIPLAGGDASITPNDILLPLLAISWLLTNLTTRRLAFRWTPVTAPILAVVATMALSLAVNVSRLERGELLVASLFFLRFLEYLTLFFIVRDVVETRAQLQRLLRLLLATAVAVAFLGFVQLVLFPDFSSMVPQGWDPHVGRLLSTWYDPNFVSALFVVSALLVLAQALARPPQRAWPWFCLAALFALATVLTFSRSGYVALVVGFSLLTLPHRRARWLFVVGVFIALAVFVGSPRVQERVIGIRTVDETAQLRLVSWQNALTVIRDYPLFGVGYNAYRYAQRDYGFILDTQEHSASGSDSSLLTMWVTTGFLGLVALTWLWVSSFWFAWRESRASTLRPEDRAFAFGVAASFAALFVHAQFVNSFFYPHLLEVVWVLLALLVVHRRLRLQGAVE